MLKPKGLELGHAYWWVFSSSGFPTFGQNESAPAKAPVGHSIHGMGCVSSSSS